MYLDVGLDDSQIDYLFTLIGDVESLASFFNEIAPAVFPEYVTDDGSNVTEEEI